jgi:putative tricarboxylic transport membrane protein
MLGGISIYIKCAASGVWFLGAIVMEHIFLAFAQIMTPEVFIFLFTGVFVGLAVGSIPGINDTVTLAVLIPISFTLEPASAFMLLVGVYCSACYGGSIPAILLKIPGTASSVVTLLDGHPMTQQGKAGKALGISTASSVFGGLASALVLMFFAPALAVYALKFGPAEYCALAILGFSTVAGLSGNNVLKSLIVCTLGLFVSTIGLSPQTGYPRYALGSVWLYEGVPFVPMLIGLFGVASVFNMVEKMVVSHNQTIKESSIPEVGRIIPSFKMVKRLMPTWLTSTAIGNIIGIIPGAGMLMAIYLSYGQAVRSNKDKEFGTGVPEGIAAPEAANNAVVASSMVPLLSLGVPGNATSALFLGALMIQGFRPGPALFDKAPDVAYLIIVGFFVANLIMAPLGLLFSKFLSRAVFKIPQAFLASIVILLCCTGAYAIDNSLFNIWVTLIFGVVGFVFDKVGLPHAPFVLAIILGSMLERGFSQALAISQGSYMIFIEKPISLALLIASLCFVLLPLSKYLIQKIKVRRI